MVVGVKARVVVVPSLPDESGRLVQDRLNVLIQMALTIGKREGLLGKRDAVVGEVSSECINTDRQGVQNDTDKGS